MDEDTTIEKPKYPPQEIIDMNKVLADFIGKIYDTRECDVCGTLNPECFIAWNKTKKEYEQTRLTKCCSTKRIGTDEDGFGIYEDPKKVFYNITEYGTEEQYATIGKAVIWDYKRSRALGYHRNWDYLIPVIQKAAKECESTDYDKTLLYQTIGVVTATYPIEEAHKWAYYFIKREFLKEKPDEHKD